MASFTHLNDLIDHFVEMDHPYYIIIYYFVNIMFLTAQKNKFEFSLYFKRSTWYISILSRRIHFTMQQLEHQTNGPVRCSSVHFLVVSRTEISLQRRNFSLP